MTEPIDFGELFADLTPRSQDFPIGGKPHRLREATEDAVCKWRNAQLRATKMVDGRVTGVDGLHDSEPLLVSLCLYELREQKNKAGEMEIKEHPVPVTIVRGWPSRVVKKLFELCKELSGLDEDTPEGIKKRIALDQKRLSELESQNGTGGEAKNSGAGETTSASSASGSPD